MQRRTNGGQGRIPSGHPAGRAVASDVHLHHFTGPAQKTTVPASRPSHLAEAEKQGMCGRYSDGAGQLPFGCKGRRALRSPTVIGFLQCKPYWPSTCLLAPASEDGLHQADVCCLAGGKRSGPEGKGKSTARYGVCRGQRLAGGAGAQVARGVAKTRR